MIPRTLCLAIVLCSVGFGLVACEDESDSGSGGPADAPTKASGQPSAAVQAEATRIFTTRCTPCHGALGHGDGPTSKGLTPQPRNLADKAWQGTIDDAYLERVIQLGGAAVGKSPAMPPNPDLSDKPEVLKALRARVRSLAP